MIFGRKKRQADVDQPVEAVAAADEVEDSGSADTEETSEVSATVTDEGASQIAEETLREDDTEDLVVDDLEHPAAEDEADQAEAGTDADGTDETDEVEIDVDFLDAQDWRTEGPWDDTEVDIEEFLAATDVPRIDLGSLILTGTEGMDVQLQVAEETQQIVSAMMLLGEQLEVDGEIHELGSALEVAAFAAPRSGGFWSEVREELIEGAEQAGGNAGLVEGPFGVEVRRLLLVDTPDGEQGYQPSRMWVAEGPRWILRGVVYGHAALEGVPGGHAERIVDLFRQIVVRRGDEPMAPGDLLALRLPENLAAEATEES